MEGIFIRYIELPIGTEAVVMPNNDCTFDIYINSNLCKQKQQEALLHELEHINHDHLYNEDAVALNEQEAG